MLSSSVIWRGLPRHWGTAQMAGRLVIQFARGYVPGRNLGTAQAPALPAGVSALKGYLAETCQSKT
jgi:hypothetical protein